MSESSAASGRIALIFAMEAEAAGVIRSLGLLKIANPPSLEHLPFQYFRGSQKGTEILVSLNGKDPRHGIDNIGLEPAAINAFATVQAFKPDVLISAGTAGSFAKLGSEIGSVYLSEKYFTFHDHRIPLTGFEAYAKGLFPSLDVSDLAREFGFKTGIVSSGSSLDYTAHD